MSEAPFPKPANIADPVIQELCERVVPGGTPEYLDVEARPGSVENECYVNVDRVIASAGGHVLYGWQIWETMPGVFAEAEFHAVWVDTSGIKHDVSPKSYDITRILFVPDPVRTYKGQQIDNVRVPLQDDQLIRDFIENAEQRVQANNEGDLADQHGLIAVTPKMQQLVARGEKLSMEIMQKYFGPWLKSMGLL